MLQAQARQLARKYELGTHGDAWALEQMKEAEVRQEFAAEIAHREGRYDDEARIREERKNRFKQGSVVVADQQTQPASINETD